MDKQTRNYLLIGGFIYVAYLFAKRTAAKISIGNAGVRVHSINLGNIQLRIDLPVLNESQIPASVDGFLGQIFYGANSIGTVTLLQSSDIPSFGQTMVKFRADISTISAGLQILQILQNPPIDWQMFRIKGTLLVGPLPIDIDQKLVAA